MPVPPMSTPITMPSLRSVMSSPAASAARGRNGTVRAMTDSDGRTRGSGVRRRAALARRPAVVLGHARARRERVRPVDGRARADRRGGRRAVGSRLGSGRRAADRVDGRSPPVALDAGRGLADEVADLSRYTAHPINDMVVARRAPRTSAPSGSTSTAAATPVEHGAPGGRPGRIASRRGRRHGASRTGW